MKGSLVIDEGFYFRLKPNIQVAKDESSLYLVSDDVFQINSPPKLLLDAIQLLDQNEGVAEKELERVLGKSGWRTVLDQLNSVSVLQASPSSFAVRSTGTEAYYDSVHESPVDIEVIRNASVFIVGCGGIGGEVARHLAVSGVGKLHLVDGDVVEKSNLNRQYCYSLQDIGRCKVDCLKDSLLGVSEQVSVCTYNRWISHKSDLDAFLKLEIDFVLCCADTPRTVIELLLVDFAAQVNAQFAMATVGVLKGAWGPILMPKDLASFREWHSKLTISYLSSELRPVKASFGPTNSIIGALLAKDVIHTLLKRPSISRGARITLDFDTMHIYRQSICSRYGEGRE